ncbi:MAG: class I SAM-dependent methyltransferase [Ignavibacteriae bacterium]|nr:class I SAM-dependent methyltransferase [Ignavibacteriota bacterium]
MKVKNFFNSVSGFFDNMTDAKKIIAMRSEALKKFIPEGAKFAADLGCGTGSDSISLALNGLKVTGFDISDKMIEKAKANSIRYGVNSVFMNYSIDKIPSAYLSGFNVAVSLGNSMALVNDKLLNKSINKIYKILKPGGVFVMQILNYNVIKKSGSRIVNITENPPNVYVRFYDVFGMPMNFNILRFKKDDMKDYELLTTKLYPYDRKFLIEIMKSGGFKKIETYSDLNKGKFNNEKSKDLVLIAYKN